MIIWQHHPLTSTESTTSSIFSVFVSYAIAVFPCNDSYNVLPAHLPADCYADSVCDKLHLSFTACLASMLLETVSHNSLLHCLVLTMLTWENIRSTHADECGNATSLHISSDKTSNFGLSFLSVNCFSSFPYLQDVPDRIYVMPVLATDHKGDQSASSAAAIRSCKADWHKCHKNVSFRKSMLSN